MYSCFRENHVSLTRRSMQAARYQMIIMFMIAATTAAGAGAQRLSLTFRTCASRISYCWCRNLHIYIYIFLNRRMCAGSSLMLATFYLVDGCARLRTDRLHRRDRKNSWSARLQTWLARVRDRTLSRCCHVPRRRTPIIPGGLNESGKVSSESVRACTAMSRASAGPCSCIMRTAYAAACRRHRAADSCALA